MLIVQNFQNLYLVKRINACRLMFQQKLRIVVIYFSNQMDILLIYITQSLEYRQYLFRFDLMSHQGYQQVHNPYQQVGVSSGTANYNNPYQQVPLGTPMYQNAPRPATHDVYIQVQQVHTTKSINLYCGVCRDHVDTEVISWPNHYAWGACVVCCLSGCLLCCCLPLVFEPLQAATHRCNRCHTLIAKK